MTRPLRLCLITPELPPYKVGGIGTYVAVLAAEFGRLGHAVDVVGCDLHPEPRLEHPWGRSVSLRAGAHPLGGALARAVEGAARWAYRRGLPGAWRAYPYAATRYTAAAALTLRRFVQSRGRHYDVVEYTNWSSHAAWLPARRRGVYVARLSTSAADVGGYAPVFALERRAVRRADAVVAHSHAMARKGEALYGLPAGSVHTVALGLADGPTAAPPEGGLRLVAVGRAEDRKGTDLLLTALAEVLPKFPRASFRFVGPGLPGYLAARPAAAVAWTRLQAECPGRAEDLSRVPDADRERAVGAAHWLVVPSRFESFGLVAVEAMRAGTPAVYATAGGLDEVGSACPANVAVRPNDADDLARALADVCRAGPDAARAARPAARRAFEESFSAAAMAERTLAVYRATLGKRP
jgi:glycosyltransferase involved in cell wall biosynthesis